MKIDIAYRPDARHPGSSTRGMNDGVSKENGGEYRTTHSEIGAQPRPVNDGADLFIWGQSSLEDVARIKRWIMCHGIILIQDSRRLI